MRAVVLSDDRIIEYLNENFINIWVSNVELERTPNKRAYIAKRRQHGFKPFDKTHPLTQAIMKGWKAHSPSDSLVISPKLELMGRLPVNERSYQNPSEHYLMFLKRSLAGKLPGFGEDTSASPSTDWETVPKSGDVPTDVLKIVLTGENPEQEILSTFRAPGQGYQDYTVVEIDATAFENGGWLTINLLVGDDEAAGSFDLYPGDSTLPTEGMPDGALTSAWDVPPEMSSVIEYYFVQGQVFKLGATGGWFSEKGSINGFLAKISVDPEVKPEQRKVSATHPYQSPEDLMNAFVKAFKNLDSEALESMITGNARATFDMNAVPENMRAEFSQILSQMEVVSSEYVDDEFHFRLRVPMADPPETSFMMRKVDGVWLIYDTK